MKKYTFGVWLDIDASDEDEALTLFDSVIKNTFVSDSYCFEWKEINNDNEQIDHNNCANCFWCSNFCNVVFCNKRNKTKRIFSKRIT